MSAGPGIAAALGLSVAAGAACWYLCPGLFDRESPICPVPVLVSPSAQGGHAAGAETKPLHVEVLAGGEAAAPSSGFLPVYLGADLRQTLELDVLDEDLEPRDDLVVLHVAERDPATGDWYTTAETYSASFAITDVEARTAGDLFVVGQARNGDDIVERWLITPPAGAITVARSVVTTPVGTPSSGSSVVSGVVGGGGFVPPAERTGTSTIERFELYRGTALGTPRDIAVDPDGRFVMVLSDTTSELWRIDLLPEPAAPLLTESPTTLPALATAGDFYPLEHATAGRVLLFDPDFSRGPGAAPTLLFDGENDGLFELPLTLSVAEFQASFPDGSFVDNFFME